MTEQLEATDVRADATKRGDEFQTVNPATGEPGKSYPRMSMDDAHAAAAAAHQAYRNWRRTSFDERAGVVRKAAAILRQRKDEIQDRPDGSFTCIPE